MQRLLAILLALTAALAARAQSVDFKMDQTEGWVGSAMVMQIEVSNASSATPPTADPSPAAGAVSAMIHAHRPNGLPRQPGPMET